MPRRLLAGFAVSLLALAGCGQLLDALLDVDDVEPPVKNEAGVLAVGQQFGEAIQKENYPAAYALLTISRRADQTLEQFTATCKQQRQDYFQGMTPAKVDTYAYMPFEDDLPDWTGLPVDVKYDALLGVCTVIWEKAVDYQVEDEEADSYVNEVDVVVVEEGGQPKIAHIDWQDEY
jgi:hypothetical protein